MDNQIIQAILFIVVVLLTYFFTPKKLPFPNCIETYFKSILFGVAIFFVINSIWQSVIVDGKLTGFFDLGTNFQNLPNYLVFFATSISAYYIYKTLNNQRIANEKAAFENRFFNFIDYHRENVSQLKYRKPNEVNEEYWEGNAVFTIIHYEILKLLDEYFKENTQKEPTIQEKITAINFIYQSVFYGSGKAGLEILRKRFASDLFQKIDFEKKKAAYLVDGESNVYYSGHVRRLGHYFRNIYQVIKYVDKQTFLSPNEKYEYITIFRAQMSVYEQSVFFFNSLSELGDIWEWKHYEKTYPQTFNEKKETFNTLWITKYDLIRNTLNNDGHITKEISITDFYPLINLERGEECGISEKLPFKGNNEHICRFCFNEKYIGYENKYHENVEYLNKTVKERISEYFIKNKDKAQVINFNCKEKDCVGMRVKESIFSINK